MIFSNQILGSSLSLPAYGREGQGQHLLFWRRISQSEIRNSTAEKRGRAKIPSPQPPSFLPVCWKPPAIFSGGGGTSNWVAGGVRLF